MPIPSAPLIEIGYQALRRLGHSPKPIQAALDYTEGRTMPVPAGDRIAVSGARRRVDLVTTKGLRQKFRPTVEQEAIVVA